DDIGNVIGVDERLADIPDWHCNLTLQDRVHQEAFAEVLVEPARTYHRPLRTGISNGLLTALRFRLTAAGQQDEPRHAPADRGFCKRLDHAVGSGYRHIRVARHIRLPDVRERTIPRRWLIPIEGHLRGPRSTPDGQSLRAQPFGHSATSLPGSPKYQRPCSSHTSHLLRAPVTRVGALDYFGRNRRTTTITERPRFATLRPFLASDA